MRRGEPDQPGDKAVDPGQVANIPEPAPPARPKSFSEIDRDSWFADQPEVQRLTSGRKVEATLSRPKDRPAPPEYPQPVAMSQRLLSELPAIESDAAEMLSTHGHGSVTTRSAAPRSWFAQQPEWQRLQELEQREREARRMSLYIPRWLLGLPVILTVIMGAIVFGQPSITTLIEAGQRFSTATFASGDQAPDRPELRIQPLASPKQIGGEPAAVLAESNQRAPTAPAGMAPAPSVERVTILAKQPPQAEPPGDWQQLLADPASSAIGMRESVFTPSGPLAQPLQPPVETGTTPNRDESSIDPFANFSSDQPPLSPDPAPDPAPESQVTPPPQAGLGFEAIAGGVAAENLEIAAAMEQARGLFRRRDLQGAGKILRDLIAVDPQNIEALRTYGEVLIFDRRLEPALEIFSAILAIKPDDTNTLINRGTTLIALGNPAEAKADAESVLALVPDAAVAIRLRSKANAALGDMAQAMNDCDRIGSLNASKSSVEWCRAAAQNHAGNHFVAVRMFIATLGTGEQSFVRPKQVYLSGLGLYNGAIDGIASQGLVDAITACAVAKDCVL